MLAWIKKMLRITEKEFDMASQSDQVQNQTPEVQELPVVEEQPVAEELPVLQDAPVLQEQPVVEEQVPEPTFAELLQGAISQFSSDVGTLKVMDTSVVDAAKEVDVLQRGLNASLTALDTKSVTRDDAETTAMGSRDALVAVLRSWTP